MKSLMMLLFGFLEAAPSRVLASLGFGFLTFGAVTAAVNSMAHSLAASWGGIGGSILQILSLAGFPYAAGILIGGVIARVSITSLPQLGKIS